MSKNFWCRFELGQFLNKHHKFKIYGAKPCRNKDKCKCAHNPNEISEKFNYKKWRESSKSDFDLKQIHKDITSVFKRNYNTITNEKLRQRLIGIEKLNIIDLCILWEDVNYDYEKSGNNIFSIPNKSDVVLFVRTLKACETYKTMMANSKKKQSLMGLCTGSMNCNRGIHNPKDLACHDDILYGECSCISLEEFKKTKKQLSGAELKKYIDSRCYHYTDHKMKPFNYIEPVKEPVIIIPAIREFKPVVDIVKTWV